MAFSKSLDEIGVRWRGVGKSISRVEEWGTLIRLQHTSVSGFPRAWLSGCIPYRAPYSPLVEPDVQISRIRLS